MRKLLYLALSARVHACIRAILFHHTIKNIPTLCSHPNFITAIVVSREIQFVGFTTDSASRRVLEFSHRIQYTRLHLQSMPGTVVKWVAKMADLEKIRKDMRSYYKYLGQNDNNPPPRLNRARMKGALLVKGSTYVIASVPMLM
jgi:hypothetical protein